MTRPRDHEIILRRWRDPGGDFKASAVKGAAANTCAAFDDGIPQATAAVAKTADSGAEVGFEAAVPAAAAAVDSVDAEGGDDSATVEAAAAAAAEVEPDFV